MTGAVHRSMALGLMLGFVLVGFSSLPSQVVAPEGIFVERPLRVLFVGDIMLDRNVARTAEEEGAYALIAGVAPLFASSTIDLRVGNLEGTITTEESIARRNNKILRFTFEPALAQAVLMQLRFDALSLANNHALDFGHSGYDETRERLEAMGIKPFGQPLNDAGTLSTKLEAQGRSLCLVGYHSLFKSDTTSVVAEITKLRPECWRIVVVPHWGEEYQLRSHAQEQEAAREFIEAGADAVVGAHPHVRQEVGEFGGKPVFYSLGNFLFDQNFSRETQQGYALVLEFWEERTEYTLIPTTIIDQKAAIAGQPLP